MRRIAIAHVFCLTLHSHNSVICYQWEQDTVKKSRTVNVSHKWIIQAGTECPETPISHEYLQNEFLFCRATQAVHEGYKKKEEDDSMIACKKKMDFKIYQKMCELSLKEDDKEFTFAYCILMLMWNLIAQSENVVCAHMYHITWEDDVLAFHFVTSKGDQTGWNREQA